MHTDLRTPGAPAAIVAGCTCDPKANGHGLGYCGIPGVWDLAADCPLHAKRADVRANHFGVVAGAADGAEICDREDMKGDF